MSSSKKYLTSRLWNDRNEVRLCGSIDGAPLVERTNGKLQSTFFVHTIIAKHCTKHRCVATGKWAQRMSLLKRGDLVKVAGSLENGVIHVWNVIEHSTEGRVVANADPK